MKLSTASHEVLMKRTTGISSLVQRKTKKNKIKSKWKEKETVLCEGRLQNCFVSSCIHHVFSFLNIYFVTFLFSSRSVDYGGLRSFNLQAAVSVTLYVCASFISVYHVTFLSAEVTQTSTRRLVYYGTLASTHDAHWITV